MLTNRLPEASTWFNGKAARASFRGHRTTFIEATVCTSIERHRGEWFAEDVRDGSLLVQTKTTRHRDLKASIHERRRRVEGQASIQTFYSHDNDSKLLRLRTFDLAPRDESQDSATHYLRNVFSIKIKTSRACLVWDPPPEHSDKSRPFVSEISSFVTFKVEALSHHKTCHSISILLCKHFFSSPPRRFVKTRRKIFSFHLKVLTPSDIGSHSPNWQFLHFF